MVLVVHLGMPRPIYHVWREGVESLVCVVVIGTSKLSHVSLEPGQEGEADGGDSDSEQHGTNREPNLPERTPSYVCLHLHGDL